MKKAPLILKKVITFPRRISSVSTPAVLYIVIIVLLCTGAGAFFIQRIHTKPVAKTSTDFSNNSGNNTLCVVGEPNCLQPGTHNPTSPAATTSTTSSSTPSSSLNTTATNSNTNSTPGETQQQATEAACKEDGLDSGNVSDLNASYRATSQTTKDQINLAVANAGSPILSTQQALQEINQAIDQANSYYNAYYNTYLSNDKLEGCTPTVAPPRQIPECLTIQECADTQYPN